MRTRQRFTAIGAVMLAAGAIASGALVTSSAMADEPPTGTATITVVTMHEGDAEAIKCTFENVELPSITFQSGTPGAGAGFVVSGSAALGEEPPEDGAIFSTFPGDVPPPGGGETVIVSAGEAVLDDGGGTAHDGPLHVFTFDDANVREGTAEECADLEPDLPTP